MLWERQCGRALSLVNSQDCHEYVKEARKK